MTGQKDDPGHGPARTRATAQGTDPVSPRSVSPLPPMPAAPTGLLWIVVHYRSPRETAALLASLARQAAACGPALHVRVVDHSGDAPPVPDGLDAVVWTPGQNLGYFGGAAWALDRWHAERLDAPPAWVVVSNADLDLPDADTVARLLTSAYADDVLVVAPGVETEDGVPLNPFLRARPSARSMRIKRRVVFSSRVTLNLWSLASRLRPRRTSAGPAGPIYAPHGAVVAFRHGYFAQGGSLRHTRFLYLEEIFVAETVRRLQGQVVFDPTLRVRHRGHVSTGVWRFGETALHHLDAFADATRRYFST